MIVSEKNVSDALAYLAHDPHDIAKARKAVTDAENECEAMKAKLYAEAEGSIKDREYAAERSEAYKAAKRKLSEALFELERHRARTKAAEMLIEVWRSENANARTAERVR